MTSTLRTPALLTLLALGMAVPATAQSNREGWRLGGGAGIYKVDDLVGTPLVPTITIGKAVGARAYVGLDVAGFFKQGRYSADFLTGDLDLGVRVQVGAAELTVAAGPSGFAGGDSDGTPYTGGGVQGSIGITGWLADRVGLTVKGRTHYWWGTSDGFLPGVTAGIVFRL